MKSTLSILAASLLLAFSAHAEDAHHPGEKATAAAAKTPVQPDGEVVKKMQGNVKRMQTQIDRLAKAKTTEERQKLLAEHKQTMHENMLLGKTMAGGDMDCPMMEGGMGMMGKKGMGKGGMGSEAMMDHMQQMEKRMDMMQMMMEQMNKSQPMPMPAK